jgi:hypothetical protein
MIADQSARNDKTKSIVVAILQSEREQIDELPSGLCGQ